MVQKDTRKILSGIRKHNIPGQTDQAYKGAVSSLVSRTRARAMLSKSMRLIRTPGSLASDTSSTGTQDVHVVT